MCSPQLPVPRCTATGAWLATSATRRRCLGSFRATSVATRTCHKRRTVSIALPARSPRRWEALRAPPARRARSATPRAPQSACRAGSASTRTRSGKPAANSALQVCASVSCSALNSACEHRTIRHREQAVGVLPVPGWPVFGCAGLDGLQCVSTQHRRSFARPLQLRAVLG